MDFREAMCLIGKFCWPQIEAPPSLFVLSMEAIISNLDRFAEPVQTFPRFIKTLMLRKMTKSGFFPKNTMKLLANEEVKSLDLSCCDLADEDIEALHICSRLYKLDLRKRETITSGALISLWPHLTQLCVLLLRKCPAVNDEVVEAIAENCKTLRELDLGYCRAITNVSMPAISENLLLWSICISGTQITDVGVASLVEGKCGERLSEIIVNDCKNLTDKSIDLISKNCPKLKIIVFRGCNINENSAFDNLYTRTKLRQLAWTVY